MATNSDACLFSIIIPTYNSAATIGECLDSIVAQRLTDYEVLVIDGFSEDNTVEIVNKYVANHPIKVISETDNGIYDAMNKGIDMAKGKWLYFLGSDDALYHEHVLSRVRNLAWNHAESQFIYGDVITSNGEIERYQDYSYDQLLGRCICHQSIFYHHSLFNNGLRYNLKYKVCADWDLNLKVFRRAINPVYVDLVIARFSLGGVSGKWWEHPEYLGHFANKKKLILRYRGLVYLFGYALRKINQRISS